MPDIVNNSKENGWAAKLGAAGRGEVLRRVALIQKIHAFWRQDIVSQLLA
ncbi:hypothetical protein [Pseudoruegeria sp. HB172150]|nr:hypothetical protein [Pseudoruegeria sp. HB172150]